MKLNAGKTRRGSKTNKGKSGFRGEVGSKSRTHYLITSNVRSLDKSWGGELIREYREKKGVVK